MRGAECSTDHHLIRSTSRLSVRPPASRLKPMHKLNVHAAHNQNIREEQRNAQSLSHKSTTTTLTAHKTILWSGRLFTQHFYLLRNLLLATWRDDIKNGSMTIPLTSFLLSTIKMLHTLLSCARQLLALFMNVFPLSCT